MIVDHVWRPPTVGSITSVPYADRLCHYLNCRRPLAEHARAISAVWCIR